MREGRGLIAFGYGCKKGSLAKAPAPRAGYDVVMGHKVGDASLRQLRYFAALAEDLHFGKAALKLGISQPTLTRQIQSLEKIVGAALVERTQRNVALTPAGAAFVVQARRTLDQHERSVETARNVARRAGDSLVIGFESCAPFHDFPGVVKEFMARYPRTRLSTFQMSGPEQAEALARNRIDLGFVHPPVPDRALFAFDRVADERFVVAMPARHRLASRKRVPAAELAKEKFVLFPRALAPGCFDAIQRICQAAGFKPEVVHESNEISVSLKLIPVVGAVTLFPECVGRQRARGVAFCELEGSVTTVSCGFLRRASDGSAPAARFVKIWRTVKAQV
jgi:DNA-binding transcriptional LysR family regulator